MKNKKKRDLRVQKEETTVKTEVYSGEQNTINIQIKKAKENPAALVLLAGPSEFIGFYWPIEKPVVVVGRSRRLSDIVIPHTSVSKAHFQLVQKSGDIFLVDLNSTNNTYLNNRKLTPYRQGLLKDNSQIRAGHLIFKFLAQGRIELFSTRHVLNKAHIDSLTGAANRMALEKKGPEYFNQKEVLCLILFDVDNFKHINDTYGHLAGDFVLKNLSKIVRGLIREGDMLFRYGGDEFCLFTPNLLDKTKTIAERIRQTIEKYSFVYEGQHIPVTVSLGIGARRSKDKDWQAVCARADKAFYKAKQAGRNQVKC